MNIQKYRNTETDKDENTREEKKITILETDREKYVILGTDREKYVIHNT